MFHIFVILHVCFCVSLGCVSTEDVPVMFKNYAEDSKRDEDVPVKFENYAEDSSRAEFGINNPVNNSELPAHEYYWARSIFGLSGSF